MGIKRQVFCEIHSRFTQSVVAGSTVSISKTSRLDRIRSDNLRRILFATIWAIESSIRKCHTRHGKNRSHAFTVSIFCRMQGHL